MNRNPTKKPGAETPNANLPAAPPAARPAVPPPAYAVGYGKPPLHTRFVTGVCANPRGRPPGVSAARVKVLALKEAYRRVRVREGDKVTHMPAIQAVLRSQLALAVKGHGPAQRAVLAAVEAIEQEFAAAAAERFKAEAAARPATNYNDAVRRISYLLRGAEQERAAAAAGEGRDATLGPQ